MFVHTSALDRTAATPPYVLIHLQGAHQLSLCRPFFSQLPDIQWVVLIECPAADMQKLSADFTAASNVAFMHNLHDAILRLDVFSAVISTWAVPHKAHFRGIQLYGACVQLGIPFLELQHGMFQIGVNYRERSKIVGDGYYGAASSLPVRNFHDHLLAWSGEGAVGYPPFLDISPAENKGYCLILSNMHWNIYGEIDQILFFETVLTTVRANPDKTFLWKPHPAELSKRMDRYFKPLLDGAEPNLQVITNDELTRRQTTTEELIRNCAYAVSSYSTVLLDLEMYGKKVAVYSPSVCAGLHCQVELCSTFVTAPDLIALLPKLEKKTTKTGRFKSGMLQPFSPERVRGYIEEMGRKVPPPKAEVARVIVPILHALL